MARICQKRVWFFASSSKKPSKLRRDTQANIGVFRAARDAILKLEQPPVSTAVDVSELARPGTLVEIEAIAVL
jgi:enamine deaminase RidA (YjgF/YER057c/UK114 family)